MHRNGGAKAPPFFFAAPENGSRHRDIAPLTFS
jgi:hypothetical protein